MAQFVPAAQKTAANYNFISAFSTFNVHKPDVEPSVKRRYGNELLSGLLEEVGHSKSTGSIDFRHFEEDWLMPKVTADSPGGAAGAAVTLTAVAPTPQTITPASPYQGAALTPDLMPVRVNDILLIKPASGTVNASNYIHAIVDQLFPATNQFSVVPQDSADAIPAFTNDEVVILTNAFGEGTNQPEGRQRNLIEYTNNVQVIKSTHEITGTERALVHWVEYENEETGQMMYGWQLKGEEDTLYEQLNYNEMALLMGESANNANIFNSPTLSEANSITFTKGLIPSIISGGGNVSNYSSVTGWTLNDAENLVTELDKNRGSKVNLLPCGIELSGSIDNELGDRFQNGGVSYGNFNMDSEKAVSLVFDSFKVKGYTFHKKTYDVFNYLQMLGAAGYGFVNEGMVIPMEDQVDAKSRERLPALRKRYVAHPQGDSREMETTAVNLFEVGDSGKDAFQVRYISHCGFEIFAPNKFAYIQQL